MSYINIKPAAGSVSEKVRKGRGVGSGKGGTSTRGHKGSRSRSGDVIKKGFEGGQMPIQRRLPKFGFTNPFRVEYKTISLARLQELAEEAGAPKVFDKTYFVERGIISSAKLLKVLGVGELKAALTVKADKFSKSAQAAIEKAGGQAIAE